MVGALLDVVFQESIVLIPQIGKIVSIGPDGEGRISPLEDSPSMVIREKQTSTYEALLLLIGNTLYEVKSKPDGSVLLNETDSSAHIQTDTHMDMRFGFEHISASIASPERVHAHILRVPDPSEPRTFCLLFDSYNPKPTKARLLFLSASAEATDNPLRANLEVWTRTGCPPIDVQGGVIAVVHKNSIWVGPKESGVLIHLEGLLEEHESAEAIALDEEGKTLACALLSRRGEGMRILRVDIQPWLKGYPPRDPKRAVLAVAELNPRLPSGVPEPDLKRDVRPYRISPQLDRLVAKASGIREGRIFEYFMVANLEWKQIRRGGD